MGIMPRMTLSLRIGRSALIGALGHCPSLNYWRPAMTHAALAKCPCLVIKTYGSDKYDRYLVDVFLLPGATDPYEVAAKGKLLNQMLIDAGFAELYQS